MLNRVLALSALAVAFVTLSGCASNDSTQKPPVNPDKEKVSTIPWNKPASWEGQGAMGGMGMGGGFGGGR